MLLRGEATVKTFQADNLRASMTVEDAVRATAGDCLLETIECISEATVNRPREDSAYPYGPASNATVAWFTGTVANELRARGIEQSGPRAKFQSTTRCERI